MPALRLRATRLPGCRRGIMVELSVSSERKPLSDEQLARESQAGSLEAFEELVSRYQQRVFGFVFRSCSCAGDAREITQDTFVKAYQALGQYDPTKPFAAWLFTIARRKCIDRHRSARGGRPGAGRARTG